MLQNKQNNRPIEIGKLPVANWIDIMKRVYSPNGIAPTIHTCGGGNMEPKVVVIESVRENGTRNK